MFNTDKYLKLLKQYLPRPIRNEKELENTERVISSFLDKICLTIEEREYLSVLIALRYEYEKKLWDELIPDIYGIELLRTILEERNLQKQDLLFIFENQSTLDDIFDGQRELTDVHIQKLADFFKIPPALFFPR